MVSISGLLYWIAIAKKHSRVTMPAVTKAMIGSEELYRVSHFFDVVIQQFGINWITVNNNPFSV